MCQNTYNEIGVEHTGEGTVNQPLICEHDIALKLMSSKVAHSLKKRRTYRALSKTERKCRTEVYLGYDEHVKRAKLFRCEKRVDKLSTSRDRGRPERTRRG